jgi:hypothetical protein
MMMAKRKVEIVAFERERIVVRPALIVCPVCQLASELLTPRQAGAMIQIKPRTIYRWLAQSKAHGVKTPGGRYRICRNSLFARLVH